MPIIVYFMKRDLFFLWCAHFIHYSDIENSFSMLNGAFYAPSPVASFDYSSWVSEVNNSY